MNSNILTLSLIICFLHSTNALEEKCDIVIEDGVQHSNCPDLYTCEAGICVHKDVFPLTSDEIIGTLLIMFVTGLANAGGSSGATLTSLFLLMFFKYNENKAIMVAYALVFGGALGNFVNVGFGRSAKTGRPCINYDLALICMPLMLLGTSLGIILNRMIAPLFITVGLTVVMYISVKKIYKKAKTEYAEEPMKRKNSTKNNDDADETQIRSLDNSPSKIKADDEVLIDEKDKNILKEEYEIFPKKKLSLIFGLLLFTIVLAIVKGTRKFPSILGLEYCKVEYWSLFALGMIICLMFFYLNRRIIRKVIRLKKFYKILPEQGDFQITDEAIPKLGNSSLLAGVIAGLLGMGGSTIMGPVLLGLGVSVETVVATSGFFVIQTSFMSVFQSLLYGDLSITELVFFMIVAFIGSYGISFILTCLVKRYQRPSIVLFILVFIFSLALVAMPVFEVWKMIGKPEEMLEFNSVC